MPYSVRQQPSKPRIRASGWRVAGSRRDWRNAYGVWCGLLERAEPASVTVSTQFSGVEVPQTDYGPFLFDRSISDDGWVDWIEQMEESVLDVVSAGLYVDFTTWDIVQVSDIEFTGASVEDRLTSIRETLKSLSWFRARVLEVDLPSFTISHLWENGFVYASHALPQYHGDFESAIAAYRIIDHYSAWGTVFLEPEDSDPASYPNQRVMVKMANREDYPFAGSEWVYLATAGGLELTVAGTSPKTVNFNLDELPNEQLGFDGKNSAYQYYLTDSMNPSVGEDAAWLDPNGVNQEPGYRFILNGNELPWLSDRVMNVTDAIKSGANTFQISKDPGWGLLGGYSAVYLNEGFTVPTGGPWSGWEMVVTPALDGGPPLEVIRDCRLFRRVGLKRWGEWLCPMEQWGVTVDGLYSPIGHNCIEDETMDRIRRSRANVSRVSASPSSVVGVQTIILSWAGPRQATDWNVSVGGVIDKSYSGVYEGRYHSNEIAEEDTHNTSSLDVVSLDAGNGDESTGVLDLTRSHCLPTTNPGDIGISISYCLGCISSECGFMDIEYTEGETE